MNKNPKFSIIVPFYNVEDYVVDCIKSIQKQTFDDFEVLCVDDCGQDSSADLVRVFAKKDERIKIISHSENKGLGAARNTALKHASGDFILCVDSDDWIKPNCLQKTYDAMVKTGYNSVWFKADMFLQNQLINQKYDLYPLYTDCPEGNVFLDDTNIINFPLISWNKVYKREFLVNNGIKWTENKFFEDVEFYWQVHTMSPYVYIIDEPLYVYRRRDNSICTNTSIIVKKITDLFDVTTNVYHFLKENNMFDKYKKQYTRYVIDTIREIDYYVDKKTVLSKAVLKYLNDINFPQEYQ